MRKIALLILLLGLVSSIDATDPPSYNNKVYAKLLRQLDGGIVDASSRSLNFIYYEEYAIEQTTVELRIFDDQSNLLVATNLNVDPGTNTIEYSLSSTTTYPANANYWIKVTNQKGEKRFLRFKI